MNGIKSNTCPFFVILLFGLLHILGPLCFIVFVEQLRVKKRLSSTDFGLAVQKTKNKVILTNNIWLKYYLKFENQACLIVRMILII